MPFKQQQETFISCLKCMPKTWTDMYIPNPSILTLFPISKSLGGIPLSQHQIIPYDMRYVWSFFTDFFLLQNSFKIVEDLILLTLFSTAKWFKSFGSLKCWAMYNFNNSIHYKFIPKCVLSVKNLIIKAFK